MHIIATTDLYVLAVDKTTKRIYFMAIGNSVLESPAFVRDWEKAKCRVSPGDSTVRSNTSQLKK